VLLALAFVKSHHHVFKKCVNEDNLNIEDDDVVALQPNTGHGLLIFYVSRSHIRRTVVGTTPLDE
jgi:hypothetical protein